MQIYSRLKHFYVYDEVTGVFTRRIGVKGYRSGEVAGTDVLGYIRITIDRKIYSAHRLAWLYKFGTFPSGEIDHIDGNKKNNAICNLRDATRTQNSQNKRNPPSNSTSGLLGSGFHKASGKWRAYITLNGKHIHIGYFSNKEDAHKAYLDKKRIIHQYCTI